jgi:DNA polymerase I-like protein with 3'-5' exonuclease and polymerase domains
MIFLSGDLSQAENRVVLMLTRDQEMITLARSDEDMHALNMRIVFGDRHVDELQRIDPDAFKEARTVGKKVSHGAQRGMSAQRLSDTILKDLGVYVPVPECEQHLRSYMRRYAPLEEYFNDLRLQVVKYRALCNSWGRILRFTYDALDDGSAFREAFSFLPQSEIADLLNQWGFKPLYHYLKQHYPGRAHINMQVHDSLLLSCEPQDAWDIAQVMRRRLERPRCYYGNLLTIPVDFSIGSTWDTEYELKGAVSRKEFEAAAWEAEEKVQQMAKEAA